MRRPAAEAFGNSTFTLAFAGIVVGGLVQAARRLKNRSEVMRLSDLDDRALKDIGLLRTDVHAALAMPLRCDPSDHLIEVAGHKRYAGAAARGVIPVVAGSRAAASRDVKSVARGAEVGCLSAS